MLSSPVGCDSVTSLIPKWCQATGNHAKFDKCCDIIFCQLNPIRPGLFSRLPGPREGGGGGLRGPDAKN